MDLPTPPPCDGSSGNTQTITGILDGVIDEYLADKSIIFRDDRERKKYLFGALEDISRSWKRSKRCMVPTCTHSSIVRSHAVPRGMLFDRVGESGHVLTPSRDRTDDGRLVLQRIGLAEASTFPGFCDTHELLFQSFENSKKVATEREVLLQAYRTACRELFRTKFWLDKAAKQIQAFQKLRDERLAERLRERLGAAGLSDVQINDFRIADDPLLLAWKRPLEGLRELSVYLESKLVPALEAAVFAADESGLTVSAVDIDIEIPVGLSGAASIPRRTAGHEGDLHFLMGLLPHVGGSLVFIVGTAEDQGDLTSYEERWMQNALEFLSMIESWMINGTDQWYLQPSVWDKLGAQRQALILEEIDACLRNVYEESEQAIFDDVRQNLLAAFKADHGTRADAAYLEFIQKHRAKSAVV